MSVSADIRSVIVRFLTPEKVAVIAQNIGFGRDTQLTPNEYTCLLDRTTKVVIEKLKRTYLQHSANQQLITSLVDNILSAQCHQLSAKEAFPEVMSARWLIWITDFWSISDSDLEDLP